MNGLDLFSGIGGLTAALAPWITPIAYCENDRYAQSVLLSRMRLGDLSCAPIWDDVRTLKRDYLPVVPDIIYGGFPCQDISVAGRGRGLEGERSGLFREIMRLAEEIKPSFIFLENVPAIRTRGLDVVVCELAALGFDARWTTLTAQEIGAPHRRDRWFILGSNTNGLREPQSTGSFGEQRHGTFHVRETMADSTSERRSEGRSESTREQGRPGATSSGALAHASSASWWAIEPDVGRVAHGVPARMDRIRCLGNAVVPQQAREAFKRLAGLK